MVGMGFELEDCQAAVENGKLSVNEAVDWLVLCVTSFSDLGFASLVAVLVD